MAERAAPMRWSRSPGYGPETHKLRQRRVVVATVQKRADSTWHWYSEAVSTFDKPVASLEIAKAEVLAWVKQGQPRHDTFEERAKPNMAWHLLPCTSGGAILVRGGGLHGQHPQTHVQIVPIEDARIMAASKKLLAACIFLVKHHLEVCDETCNLMGIDQMRAAIKSAQDGDGA